MLSGSLPVKELLERSRMANADIVVTCLGISPVSWLFLRLMVTSFSHEAMLEGIVPESVFDERSRFESEGQS